MELLQMKQPISEMGLSLERINTRLDPQKERSTKLKVKKQYKDINRIKMRGCKKMYYAN